MSNSKIETVHDVTCRDPAIPRRDADRMFYFACLGGGYSKTQARVPYLGVRLGDWASSTRKLTLPSRYASPRAGFTVHGANRTARSSADLSALCRQALPPSNTKGPTPCSTVTPRWNEKP